MLSRAMTPSIPTVRLNNGTDMPVLAFGTGSAWFKDDPSTFEPGLVAMLRTAMAEGYRHMDCAESYGTETEVGIAIKESGIPREELFITTKVLFNMEDIAGSIDASLKRLQLDYVDLYLIHNPWDVKDPGVELPRWWRQMEQVQRSGKARAIGLGNMIRPLAEIVLAAAEIMPAAHQLEVQPYLQREPGYIEWMQEKGIVVMACKVFTPLRVAKGGPLDAVLPSMARRLEIVGTRDGEDGQDETRSQLLLRWLLQKGIVCVTTTTTPSRLRTYKRAFSFALSDEDVAEISRVGATHHFRACGAERFAVDDRR